MSFEFVFRLNLSIVFDLLVRNCFHVVKLHKDHHLKASHIDFILFIKVCKNVKRSKIQLPWKNPSKLFLFVICRSAIKLFHIEIREYVYWIFKHWRDHTTYLAIIIWPISRRQDLNLNIIRNFLLQIPLLKFRIKPFRKFNVFYHCVHFLSIGSSTLFFELLNKVLLS